MSHTRNSIIGFIFELSAAFIVWTLKGFKGKLGERNFKT